MYHLHKFMIGTAAVGFVMLLTCHTSDPGLLNSVAARHVVYTTHFSFRRSMAPFIQAWHPSVFERMNQQQQNHSVTAIQYRRAMTTDTADELIDRLVLDDQTRGTWTPDELAPATGFTSPRVEHPRVHRKSRI